MIATNVRTLKDTAILLLKESGYSPIEALNRWNNVISVEIHNARPGTHIILIGKYELEYTKKGETETLEPAPIEPSGAGAIFWLVIFALISLLIVGTLIATNVTIFEDGSWALGSLINGCLPLGICNL
jgi:hypothetical protein